jgi:hypothetical protein
LNPRDKELQRVVDEVLHYIWDPIGVCRVPRARDEYGGYVGPIVALLRSGASPSEISQRLESIVVEHMGLSSCREQSDKVASILAAWRDHLSGVSMKCPSERP